MKTKRAFFSSIIGFSLLAGVLFSCNEDRQQTRTEKALEATGDAITEDTKDLAEDIEQKTANAAVKIDESREEFAARMQARSRELDSEIDVLQQKIERQGKKADQKVQRELDELRVKRDNLNQKITQLGRSSGNAWQDMKTGISSAVDELERGFKSARDNFEKDTIR